MHSFHRQQPSSLEGREEDSVPPPRYSTLSVTTLPVYPTAGELDISQHLGDNAGRSEPVSRQAFDFCLEDRGTSAHGEGRTWATLRLFSSVPTSLQRPRYTGGENIEGAVMLNLKRAQTIVSISVVLRGQIVTSSRPEGAHTFLEVVTPIWDSTMDVPLRNGPSPSTGKLQGRYIWPFSVPFPTEFRDSLALPGRKRKGQSRGDLAQIMYLTPQTLCQRGVNANIQYEVKLKVTTSGLFNSKHKISAPVLYVPLIRALPLPPLRASAYASGASLIGPTDDPSGWQPLPKFRVRVAFKGEACDIECTVYIAKPTAYTRGSIIPCYLICRTSDVGAPSSALLHAFVGQRCVSLELLQRVHCLHDPMLLTADAALAESGSTKAGRGRQTDRTPNLEEGGTAVWWAPSGPQDARDANGREGSNLTSQLSLEGEVHIDIALLPPSKVPFLEVTHDVHVFLKRSQGLEVSVINAEGTKELPSWPVRIVTVHTSAGPVPTSFTPPPPRKIKDRSVVQDVLSNSNMTSWFGPG